MKTNFKKSKLHRPQ